MNTISPVNVNGEVSTSPALALLFIASCLLLIRIPEIPSIECLWVVFQKS